MSPLKNFAWKLIITETLLVCNGFLKNERDILNEITSARYECGGMGLIISICTIEMEYRILIQQKCRYNRICEHAGHTNTHIGEHGGKNALIKCERFLIDARRAPCGTNFGALSQLPLKSYSRSASHRFESINGSKSLPQGSPAREMGHGSP